MNNMLTRGILRLSKRGSKSGSISSDSQSIRSGVSETVEADSVTGVNEHDEWTKYDERLIDCIHKSDITKLKETLKKKGVSPVKVSRVGKTAVHTAVKKRCMEAVDLMLLEHPDLSCIDTQGRTVYHISALNGDTIMLKKLLDYSKWNLDIKDAKGMTALHHAVQSNEPQCVKLLLDSDSPAEVKDAENRTPLLLAVAENREKVATLLIEHGVNINEQDKQGRSPIVIACSLGMTQLVSLLLSKGADKSVMNRSSINLDNIALENGHADIVELLKNGIQSSPVVENGKNDDLITNGHANGDINGDHSVNGHDGLSDLNGKHLDMTDDSLISENGHDNVEKDKKIFVNGDDGLRRYSSPVPSIYAQDDSLTSAIIESLMGFEVNCDTISETSVTEDQLHMYEKSEQERKEFKSSLAQRELRIEELQAEIDSLKNKVGMEIDLRYAAEKEVQLLKLDLETKSQRSECEAEQAQNFHSNGGDTSEDDHMITNEDYKKLESDEHMMGYKEDDDDDDDDDNHDINDTDNDDDNDDNDTIHYDEIEDNESDIDEAECDEYNMKSVRVEEDMVMENECEADAYSSPEDGNIPDSDTDESISETTGYRKKSLGTAKQHINMLEERVLCLEEELLYKSEEVTRLQLEYKNAKELVDLNNNTTIPLEIHNELKSDSKKERHAFKEQVASLEGKVKQLEQTVEDVKREKVSVQTGQDSSSDLQSRLNCEIESNGNLKERVADLRNQLNNFKTKYEVPEAQGEVIEVCKEVWNETMTTDERRQLEEEVVSLRGKTEELQQQLSNFDSTLEETVHCYRNTLISLYQNNLDSKLEEVLSNIVKLRGS